MSDSELVKKEVIARDKDFSTIKELSQRLGKCYRTIHRAVKAGRIKAVRCGGSVMIPRREVERILQRGF